jgi:hypothetical protein
VPPAVASEAMVLVSAMAAEASQPWVRWQWWGRGREARSRASARRSCERRRCARGAAASRSRSRPRHRRGPQALQRLPVVPASDRHRDAGSTCETHALSVGVLLHAEHSNATAAQLLGQTEAHLTEANEQHVVSCRRGSGSEQSGQTGAAETPHERCHAHGGQQQRRQRVQSRERLVQRCARCSARRTGHRSQGPRDRPAPADASMPRRGLPIRRLRAPLGAAPARPVSRTSWAVAPPAHGRRAHTHYLMLRRTRALEFRLRPSWLGTGCEGAKAIAVGHAGTAGSAAPE